MGVYILDRFSTGIVFRYRNFLYEYRVCCVIQSKDFEHFKNDIAIDRNCLCFHNGLNKPCSYKKNMLI